MIKLWTKLTELKATQLADGRRSLQVVLYLREIDSHHLRQPSATSSALSGSPDKNPSESTKSYLCVLEGDGCLKEFALAPSIMGPTC